MRNPKICLRAKKKCKFWNSLFSFKSRCNAKWFFSVSADSFWISYRKSAILRLHVTLCRWCRIALWDSFGDAIPFLVIATLYGKLGPNSSPKIFPLYSSSLMGNLRGDRWKKNFIYQIKTSLQTSCDRCDPVCDTWLRNQFFKGWFSHDRYDSSVCWTISSYLGEHMDTRRTLHHHFLATLIYRESKNPNQLKFPNSRL